LVQSRHANDEMDPMDKQNDTFKGIRLDLAERSFYRQAGASFLVMCKQFDSSVDPA
jgi:hypothetical protein